jgi:hypothetical protein
MQRQMIESITSGMARRPGGAQDLPGEIEGIVAAIVRRLEGQLRDGSYRELAERVLRQDGMSPYPLSGGELINIIPGNHIAACTRIAVAVATGSSPTNSVGFPSVMRAVREYIIDCERMARAVVLITDTWNPRQIDAHIRDIRAHQRQGRFVVPHLVAGGRIHRIGWPSE